jgi:predicted nucleic acid-binding protein
MHYLLDTNIVMAMMNQAVDKVLLTVEKHRRDQMATSSIVIQSSVMGHSRAQQHRKICLLSSD